MITRCFLLLALPFLLFPGSLAAQDDRSLDQGGGQVRMDVRNSTRQTVVVAWVNFEGQMESYGSLAPGQRYSFETYPGHLWKFGVGNQLFGQYRATAAARQSYTITPAPAQPPAAPAAPTTSTTPVPPSAPTAGTTPPAPAAAVGATGSKLTQAEAQQLLAIHNQARQEVGVAGMTWSAEIAAFAQQWADHLARSGQFVHRPRDQQRYGENLAAGQSVLAGAKMWYGEKNLYPAGAAFSMNLMPAAHYTQMVWRGSTQIGAGKATIASGPYAGLTVVVCNYAPQGNIVGQRPY